MAARKKPATKRVKVTLTDGTVETLQIAADYKLDLDPDSTWLQIETADGGEYAIPIRLVVAVVTQGSGG